MTKKDPLPGYGGKPLSPLLSVAVILIAAGLGIGAWVIGSSEGGYEQVDKLASVKCLGCLGLDPVIPGFEKFWTVYPDDHNNAGQPVDHNVTAEGSDTVHDIITYTDPVVDIFVLFFWTQGCVPCAEQWEEMVDEGIASGPEDGGIEGDRFDDFKMISYDAAERDGRRLYNTYIPTGDETGVPMTTFIFQGPDDEIRWYSHYGKMEIDDIHELVENIQYFKEHGNLKDQYDDIAHADHDR